MLNETALMSPDGPLYFEDQVDPGVNLHQELPPKFARILATFQKNGEDPLAALFIPSEEIPDEQTHERALVLTESGVLFMEAGEVTLGDTFWGTKSLFYPYRQIAAIAVGAAQLTGRFTLYTVGNAPVCEILLKLDELPNFEAIARIIGVKINAG